MNLFGHILSLLPLLIQGAEQLHGPGNGQAKYATVLNSLMNIAAATVPADKQELIAHGFQGAINSAVQVLNAAGALPKPQ